MSSSSHDADTTRGPSQLLAAAAADDATEDTGAGHRIGAAANGGVQPKGKCGKCGSNAASADEPKGSAAAAPTPPAWLPKYSGNRKAAGRCSGSSGGGEGAAEAIALAADTDERGQGRNEVIVGHCGDSGE